MKDKMGDGLCCEWGPGLYTVTIDGETVITSDDANFLVKNIPFDVNTLQPSPLPSLSRSPTPPPRSPDNLFLIPIIDIETRGPSSSPSLSPTPPPTIHPTTRKPSPSPTPKPVQPLTPSIIIGERLCVSTYRQIEEDIISIVDSIQSESEKAHQLGGAVRLAAQ